ncbi:MAG: hypothetical protein BAJATHORv1_10548 [Candidatus Thorarchaeota archaeon]|nr:MAG: hypothetical protein BAJATHORv1_10548 [Candidatus Thorarchaeota archaeon]
MRLSTTNKQLAESLSLTPLVLILVQFEIANSFYHGIVALRSIIVYLKTLEIEVQSYETRGDLQFLLGWKERSRTSIIHTY